MLALLASAPAAAQEGGDATLIGGVATRWSREFLAVDDFEETPAAVPARTANSIDAGSTFSWSAAQLTFELGATGGEQLTWRGAVHAGLATMRLSQEIAGAPRTTVSTAADDGLTGGVTLGLRYPGGGSSDGAWWVDAGYGLEIGYAALDNALLFGGTPIEGTAQWLRHDAALRVGYTLSGGAWSLHAGGRLAWSQLATQWELAFDVPGVARDTDAAFTTRHPARWLLGIEWKNISAGAPPSTPPLSARLELSAGRLPSDLSVSLQAQIRF
ncbi:MAG: hypothetical protein ACYTGX_10705 [Planctomycetota bacterium]